MSKLRRSNCGTLMTYKYEPQISTNVIGEMAELVMASG